MRRNNHPIGKNFEKMLKWKLAPYRLNISKAIKKGENKLEIEVVNLWRNQLIKDKQRPEEEKYTWLVTDDIKSKSKLQPSGLLGPVIIETIINNK